MSNGSPSTDDVLEARINANLTQKEAAALIGRHLNRWSEYETGIYPMPPPLWELFLVKTNQHPSYAPRT